MKPTQLDPLSPPADQSLEPGYLSGWTDCAIAARAHLADLLGSLVSVKDARIAQLERDNAALKAQCEELETFLPKSQ